MNFENTVSFASFCLKAKNDYPECAEVSFIPVALIPSVGQWFPDLRQRGSAGHTRSVLLHSRSAMHSPRGHVAVPDFEQSSRFTSAYLTLPFMCPKSTLPKIKLLFHCHSQPVQSIPVHLSKLHHHPLSFPKQKLRRTVLPAKHFPNISTFPCLLLPPWTRHHCSSRLPTAVNQMLSFYSGPAQSILYTGARITVQSYQSDHATLPLTAL